MKEIFITILLKWIETCFLLIHAVPLIMYILFSCSQKTPSFVKCIMLWEKYTCFITFQWTVVYSNFSCPVCKLNRSTKQSFYKCMYYYLHRNTHTHTHTQTLVRTFNHGLQPWICNLENFMQLWTYTSEFSRMTNHGLPQPLPKAIIRRLFVWFCPWLKVLTNAHTHTHTHTHTEEMATFCILMGHLQFVFANKVCYRIHVFSANFFPFLICYCTTCNLQPFLNH